MNDKQSRATTPSPLPLEPRQVFFAQAEDRLRFFASLDQFNWAFLVYPCNPNASTWQSPMERTRPEYPGILPLGIELPLEMPRMSGNGGNLSNKTCRFPS